MDRSWILHYQNRFSVEYIAGVNSFIDFAKSNSGGAVLINCPIVFAIECLAFSFVMFPLTDKLLNFQ
ncbi:hypothetical protein AAC387_Pa05g1257 [Persea americana]